MAHDLDHRGLIAFFDAVPALADLSRWMRIPAFERHAVIDPEEERLTTRFFTDAEFLLRIVTPEQMEGIVSDYFLTEASKTWKDRCLFALELATCRPWWPEEWAEVVRQGTERMAARAETDPIVPEGYVNLVRELMAITREELDEFQESSQHAPGP